MKEFLQEVKSLLKANYFIDVKNEDLARINEVILQGNQSGLFQIEMQLCNSQKTNCIEQVNIALDKYHHSSMDTDEIKTIVTNVLTHKAPTPEITDTVRLLLAED